MRTNEYGVAIGRYGYAPSIIQADTSHCFLCGRCDEKLDRHEPFNGPYRTKSKALGMWVALCHDRCHYGRAHRYYQDIRDLKRITQEKAMVHYGWDEKEFIRRFGKNWL